MHHDLTGITMLTGQTDADAKNSGSDATRCCVPVVERKLFSIIPFSLWRAYPNLSVCHNLCKETSTSWGSTPQLLWWIRCSNIGTYDNCCHPLRSRKQSLSLSDRGANAVTRKIPKLSNIGDMHTKVLLITLQCTTLIHNNRSKLVGYYFISITISRVSHALFVRQQVV